MTDAIRLVHGWTSLQNNGIRLSRLSGRSLSGHRRSAFGNQVVGVAASAEEIRSLVRDLSKKQ
jgi:hypothetical protein